MEMRHAAAVCLSIVFTAAAASAQQAGQADGAQGPATITERTYHDGGLLARRTVQRRTESAGRQVVVDTEERPGPDGRWEPVEQIVTETVRMGAAVQTRRQVSRLDIERRWTLMETTETQETLDGGIVRVIEETTIPDINGGSRVASRWVEERQTVDPNTRQTDATLLQRSINGGLRESGRSTQIERQIEPAVVSLEGTYQVRDLNGRWTSIEARTLEIRDTPAERIEDETIRRPDVNGSLSVSQRIVTRRSGQDQVVVETYLPHADGFYRSGNGLTLHERFRRSTTAAADGSRSVVEEVEARSLVSPGDPMRVVQRTVATIVEAGVDRRVIERRIFELDLNGRLAQIATETEESIER
jgi:hypothetical protein